MCVANLLELCCCRATIRCIVSLFSVNVRRDFLNLRPHLLPRLDAVCRWHPVLCAAYGLNSYNKPRWKGRCLVSAATTQTRLFIHGNYCFIYAAHQLTLRLSLCWEGRCHYATIPATPLPTTVILTTVLSTTTLSSKPFSHHHSNDPHQCHRRSFSVISPSPPSPPLRPPPQHCHPTHPYHVTATTTITADVT